MLHITVETITGRSFKIRVSPHETIYFVKVKICQLEGIPISHQILIWKSIELNNDHTLSSYNIPNNSTLKLTLTMKGGPINSVLTDEPSFQDMVEYLAEPGDIPSSSSSSSSLVSEKKRGALILYRYGNHSLKIASRDFTQPEAYSVEKWRVKFEDLKSKNERQVENNKLKGKMAALRKQMQKVALNKEKKLEPPFDTISNEEDANKEESNNKTFDMHIARQSPKILSYGKSNFDDHKEILSRCQIKSSFISAESGNRLIISPAKDLEEPSEPLRSPLLRDSKFMKPESWCSGVEVPWADSRSIRALMDLRHQSSSSLSVSSSSETNLEETSIDDDEEDDEDDTSILNTPNSTSLEVLNEREDGNNNNCLPQALEILTNTTPGNPRTELLMDSSEILRECALDSSQLNLSKSSKVDTGVDVEALENDHPCILPKVACDTTKTLSSRINEKLNGLSLQANNDALMRSIPSRSGLSTLQPRNPTFLDLLRSSRLRGERKNLLFSKGRGDVTARACNGVIQMSSLDLCDKGIEEGNHEYTKQKVESLTKLEDDVNSRSRESDLDRISLLPKLPPLEPLSSRSFLAPQTSLSVIRKVPNSSSSCAVKSQASEAKYSYGLLPPIQIKNSAVDSNQRCLPKLPSPTLPTRKESFSPFMKKRNGCLSTLNNSCLKREQHVMFCASEDEEDATENENACIKDNFPTLEIPGSLLSSDLSGCKVRVKKFVEGRRGLHSPNLNLMKMLEVVTRENQRSRLIGRRTGYIISTSSDPDPDISEELPASSLDSEKVLETATEPCLPPPKKKCAVCRKKTSLAASFLCRCGQNFCSSHRYPEAHMCTIDYKMEGRKVLEERNPVVNAPKLPKI